MKFPMNKCRKRLALLWFWASGALFIIVFVQVQLNHWGEDAGKVLGWFLPSLTPTLALILGVFVADAVRGPEDVLERDATNADPFFFRLTFSISSMYLAAILLVILLEPVSQRRVEVLITENNLWLVPFQAMVAASMGVFFVTHKKSPAPQTVSP